MHPLHALPILAICGGSLLLIRRLLHYFQLESYQFHGYFKTVDRQFDKAFLPGCIFSACALFAVLMIVVTRTLTATASPAPDILFAAVILLSALIIRRRTLRDDKEKKPFRTTARIKRLYVSNALTLLLIAFLLWAIFRPELDSSGLSMTIYCLIPVFLPILVALAALLIWPVERLIYELYFRDARRKLLADERLMYR